MTRFSSNLSFELRITSPLGVPFVDLMRLLCKFWRIKPATVWQTGCRIISEILLEKLDHYRIIGAKLSELCVKKLIIDFKREIRMIFFLEMREF